MGWAGCAGPVRRGLPSWGSISCDDQRLHASSALFSSPLHIKEAQGITWVRQGQPCRYSQAGGREEAGRAEAGRLQGVAGGLGLGPPACARVLSLGPS